MMSHLRLLTILRRVFPWAVALGLPLILLQHLDLQSLATTFRNSNWALVALAGLLSLVLITLGRAKRFAVLIRDLPRGRNYRHASLVELISIITATRTLNMILPARAGETLRAIQVHRRFGYPVESVVAAVAMESVLDVIALAVPSMLLLSFGFFFGELSRFLYPPVVIAVICIGLAIAFRISKRREAAVRQGEAGQGSRGGRVRVVIDRFRKAIHQLNGPRVWLKGLGWTWFVDFSDVLMIGLCLEAVGIHLHPVNWFLVLAAINIAIIVPTPGHLGTLEAGAILVLSALGVDRGPAFAFALLYHAAHLLPSLLLGSIGLQFEFSPMGRKDLGGSTGA